MCPKWDFYRHCDKIKNLNQLIIYVSLEHIASSSSQSLQLNKEGEAFIGVTDWLAAKGFTIHKIFS